MERRALSRGPSSSGEHNAAGGQTQRQLFEPVALLMEAVITAFMDVFRSRLFAGDHS